MSARFIEGVGFVDVRFLKVGRREIEELRLEDGTTLVKIDGKTLHADFTYEQAVKACVAEAQLSNANRAVMRRRK